MIFKSILFLLNLIIGGMFLWRYFYRSTFFLAQTIFVGAYSVIIFFLITIGIPLNKIMAFFPLTLVPFVFYKINTAQWRNLLPEKKRNIYTNILGFLVVIILFMGIMHVLKSPICEGDGLGIWLTKAKMITQDKTILSENFLNPYRIQDHPRYPLLLPILEASLFTSAGIDEWLVKIIFVYIWILILGSFYESFNRKSFNASLVLIVILSVVPAYYTMKHGGLDTGYADIPLSLFYLSVFILLNNYFDTGERKYLIGAGLCLSYAIFTKSEGLVFAPIILILFIIFKKKILDVLIIITATVIPALPWLITAQQLPGLYAEHYLSYVPEFFQYLHRIPMIVKTALLEVVNIKHWGIFWLFSLFVLIYSRPKREVGYFSLAVGTLMFFYLGIFLVTPWDVEFQMKVVFPRMLLHIIPATLFLVARQFFWN